MNKAILEIFNIDALGKRIASRTIFLIMVLLRCSVYFFPLGDNDFTSFIIWGNKVVGDYEYLMTLSFKDIPLTAGNYLYLASVWIINLICILCSFLYTGLFVRNFRIEHRTEKSPAPIKTSDLVFRMYILSIISVPLSLPFLTFVLYLLPFFIIIFPCLIMYPACYLSGDSGFFAGFRDMIYKSKGYYLANFRTLLLIFMAYVFLDLLTTVIGNVVPSLNYVFEPFLTSYLLLVTARFVGVAYCVMVARPIGRVKKSKVNR